ncbi:MAG TPA: AraC family transcriptional regulator, partial [Verrucomicrobiae bacterium]|nr:AraC family transcriptional regulator [Verrucomicrobiae bacterium]
MKKREMVCEVRSGRIRPGIEDAPLLSSASSPWNGVLLEYHRLDAFEVVDVSCMNHLAVLKVGTPALLECQFDGRLRRVEFQPGQINLLPAHLPHSTRGSDLGELISVSLESEFLACAASAFDGLHNLELVPKLALTDPLIESIILALKAEVEQGCPGGRLYGESLATALAVHLAHKHSAHAPDRADRSGGLAKYQLRSAIEYIRQHVGEDISLRTLAAHVGISPFHFARMFKRSTGMAPHQYLMRYRVERAKQSLMRPDTSIADVAAQLGFCDQSHLAAHFKRVYGVTPKRFLREKVISKVAEPEMATVG